MIIFLSMIVASLAVHFINGWMEPFMGISFRAMINLIVFMVVYMATSRYFKNLRD